MSMTKYECCDEVKVGLRKLEVETIFLENSSINTVKDLATGETLYRDFVEQQEYLGHEYEKILANNISDLYLEGFGGYV